MGGGEGLSERPRSIHVVLTESGKADYYSKFCMSASLRTLWMGVIVWRKMEHIIFLRSHNIGGQMGKKIKVHRQCFSHSFLSCPFVFSWFILLTFILLILISRRPSSHHLAIFFSPPTANLYYSMKGTLIKNKIWSIFYKISFFQV